MSSYIVDGTAEYTQALLAALLPIFSDFAWKLDLEVPLPIQLAHVESFHAYQTDIGGSVTLTNGCFFSFHLGNVDGFRSPKDDPLFSWRRAGERVRLTRAEAVASARAAIADLGHPPEALYTRLEPEVLGPRRVGENVAPRYIVTWYDPNQYVNLREVGFQKHRSVGAVINADNGKVEALSLDPTQLARFSPALEVPPRLNYNQPSWHDLSGQELNLQLDRIWPEIQRWNAALASPAVLPLATNALREVTGWQSNAGTLALSVVLSNDCRLLARKGTVYAIEAPDVFFNGQWVDTRRFEGRWNISEREAAKLVRAAFEKLGIPLEEAEIRGKPEAQKPYLLGPQNIPRYHLLWDGERRTRTGKVLNWRVRAEVDADRGRVVRLAILTHRVLPW